MGKVVSCEECRKAYRNVESLEDLRDNDGVCLVCNNPIEVDDWDRVLASYEDEDFEEEDDELDEDDFGEDEDEEEDDEDEDDLEDDFGGEFGDLDDDDETITAGMDGDDDDDEDFIDEED